MENRKHLQASCPSSYEVFILNEENSNFYTEEKKENGYALNVKKLSMLYCRANYSIKKNFKKIVVYV